jgi:hypothetical protein
MQLGSVCVPGLLLWLQPQNTEDFEEGFSVQPIQKTMPGEAKLTA